MKNLSIYLKENINPMFEATFSKSDFFKHDYKYPIELITDILTAYSEQKEPSGILLGKNGEGGDLDITKLDDHDIDMLRDLLQDITNKTPEDLNKILNKDESKKSIWNTIFKGKYSAKALKISTSDQEEATCKVWNWFVEDDPDMESNDFKNNLNQLVNIFGEEKKFDSTWITTFKLQINAIMEIINLMSPGKKTYTNYRAARVGGDDEIAKIYEGILNDYAKKQGAFNHISSKKDAYCTSDIILYTNAGAEALKKLNNLQSNEEYAVTPKSLEPFIKLVTSKEFIGISLKKLSKDYEVKKFNYPNERIDVKVNSFDLNVQKTKGTTTLYIKCRGKFEIDGQLEDDNENEVWLVLRSFGDYNVAMDCKQTKAGISLGKNPVGNWRDAIQIDIKKKDQVYINKYVEDNWVECGVTKSDYEHFKLPAKYTTAMIMGFLKYFNSLSSSDQNEKLTQYISSSTKNGGLCLPFILIH